MPETESHFSPVTKSRCYIPLSTNASHCRIHSSDSPLLENRLKRYAQTIIAVLLLSLAAATFFAWRSQRALSLSLSSAWRKPRASCRGRKTTACGRKRPTAMTK